MKRCVFVTGATGYIGRALTAELLARGHAVRALTRKSSSHRIPPGATIVEGDALDAATFAHRIAPADTFVHLVGTPHPNPLKSASFRSVDLRSVEAAIGAAKSAGIAHFVYLSVAQPAPVMRAYIEVRQAGEAMIRASGIPATILRPWYVLGPGHWWPYALAPAYVLLERIPATRDFALRLGMISLSQMLTALIHCIEAAPAVARVMDVTAIRNIRPTAH